MMTVRIRVFMILFTLFFFWFIIKTIRKAKMSKDLASIWLLLAMGILVVALIPQIADLLAFVLGIETVSNVIFIVAIFILFGLCFFLFVQVAILEYRLNNLIQRLGIQEKEERDREKA